MDAIGDYFDRNGYPEKGAYNLKGFISTSEALKEQTRIAIEKAFECPCISRYSNMEQGIIAQEISGYQGHIINEAHYLVELLKIDQDLPAVDGEVGRIVITDYFNAGMPFVRYDTGDLGILGYVEIDGNRKRCVKSIEGRITDVILILMINRSLLINYLYPFGMQKKLVNFSLFKQQRENILLN